MRFSLIACSVALVAASSFAFAAEDTQAKCQQKLSANAEKIAQVKQLAGMLGNQAVSDTVAQVEGGCEQLGANASASAEPVAQTKADGTVADVAAAAETLKSLGSLFGKQQ